MSIFAEFNRSRFDCIQIATSSTHADVRFCNCTMECVRRKSAYHRRIGEVKSMYFDELCRSAVYNRNRIGPSTDPCWAPYLMHRGVDVDPPHRTNELCAILLRYDDSVSSSDGIERRNESTARFPASMTLRYSKIPLTPLSPLIGVHA